MRDIFEDIFEHQPLDPREAARRTMRPKLRARFYKAASVGAGNAVLLDERPVRTPARYPLVAPAHELALSIAREWEAQREVIDPAQMPLTRLANSIIDSVAASPAPVRTEIENYLASDLLFYRTPATDGLAALHAQHWDPVLEWAHAAFGARFVLAEGVIHVRQPGAALAAASAAIPNGSSDTDLWRLGAMNVVTTLTGSALLALALGAGRLTVDETWRAAHVDEDWNMEAWGRDDLALDRRNQRFAEMQAAALVLAALKP